MRKVLWSLCPLFALLPAAATAAPLKFFCAAPLSSWSQLDQVLPGPTHRISGVLRPGQMEEIQDPSLPLIIKNGNVPSTSRYADVTLTAADHGPYLALRITPRYERDAAGQSIADVYVQFRRDEDAADEGRPLGTIVTRGYLWERLPFSIDARGDRVIVEAGGQRTELPIRIGAGAEVELSCIGGAFNFENMEWGAAAGAAVAAR